MRNRFDKQLQLLEEQLITMGQLCETAIESVTTALKNGNVEEAKAVISADEEIDQIEKDIERLCLKLLLQQQPVARDLRRISAALKMITDMERIGDQTADIADIVKTGAFSLGEEKSLIVEMSTLVNKMVNQSVVAYVNKDLALAREVIIQDDQVDEYFDEFRESMISKVIEEKGTNGEQVFDLIMISKYLERIGDHATNIAEWVEFSITGVHRSLVMPES